jgi:hypothetical protein
MALTAGQINPALYPQPDYSGVVESARRQAQGIADLGANIGGAITEVGDYFKKQKEQVKSVDVASRIAGLLESKAPNLIPGIGELRMTLENQEIPLSQRIAAAESLFSVMDTGFKVNQMINQEKAMNMRMERSSAANSGRNDNPLGVITQPPSQ